MSRLKIAGQKLRQRLTQILIYSYHILNRLVDELKKTNLMPNSEMRFNVARRILIAEIQAITYQQWLPLVLGDEIMHEVRNICIQIQLIPQILLFLSLWLLFFERVAK